MAETTTIQISKKLRKGLGNFAGHDETMDQAIGRLLSFYEENKK